MPTHILQYRATKPPLSTHPKHTRTSYVDILARCTCPLWTCLPREWWWWADNQGTGMSLGPLLYLGCHFCRDLGVVEGIDVVHLLSTDPVDAAGSPGKIQAAAQALQ
jgi:hypothetical protein